MRAKALIKTLKATPLDGRNKLRDAMRLARVTQVQLSERTGIGQAQISKIIRGQYRDTGLPLDQARVLADALGVSIDDIFPAERSLAS